MASMSYRELVALLRQHGCTFVRQGKGSHQIWFSPITQVNLVVPNPVKGDGVVHGILKDAGIKRRGH